MEKRQYERMYAIEDRHWWFTAKRAFIRAHLPDRSNLKIVDLGCGTGGTTQFLQMHGSVMGIEANPLAVNLAKKRGLTVIKQDINNTLPFKTGSIDLVTVFDVLYHQKINDEITILKEVRRILKKNGHLLLTDCAHPTLSSPHDTSVMAKKRYTKKQLESLVASAGFHIEKTTYIFCHTFPLFLIDRIMQKIQQRPHLPSVPPKFLNTLLTLTYQIEAALSKHVSLPIGSSILIKASK